MRLSLVRSLMCAVLLSTIAGCGGGDDSTGRFVGTWKFTGGSTTYTCPGLDVAPQAASGNLTISKGASSDLVVVNNQCSLKFDVTSGTTANARPGQQCTSINGGTTEVDTFSDIVLSTSDGVTAHLSMTMTGVATNADGTSITCTATELADLQKL